MSIDHIITGKLNSVVALTYVDCGLSHGKWKTQPSGVVAASTLTQIFEGWNRGSTVQPACGWCRFIAADGTKFTFHFEDNISDDNYCWTTMEDVSGPYKVKTPDYPKTSKTFTVTYYIESRTSSFFDAPVFSSDILTADKCDLYADEKLQEFIGQRDCIYLRDVFAISEMHPDAKIWCATSPLFLTPLSKSILTRDLVLAIEKEVSTEMNSFLPILEKMTAFNENLSNENIQENIQGSYSQELKQAVEQKYIEAKSKNLIRDCELIDATFSLLNSDLSEGWSAAVSSYLGRAENLSLARRRKTIVNIIEGRL